MGGQDSRTALDRLLQQRHPHRDDRRAAALVSLATAGPCQRLVHVLGGDHPEGAGNTRVELDALGPRGDLVADVVVVAGLPADDDAEARYPGEATGLGAELG